MGERRERKKKEIGGVGGGWSTYKGTASSCESRVIAVYSWNENLRKNEN
jgi:hypothetical protein